MANLNDVLQFHKRHERTAIRRLNDRRCRGDARVTVEMERDIHAALAEAVTLAILQLQQHSKPALASMIPGGIRVD